MHDEDQPCGTGDYASASQPACEGAQQPKEFFATLSGPHTHPPTKESERFITCEQHNRIVERLADEQQSYRAYMDKENDRLRVRINRLEKLLQLIILTTAHED